METRLEILVGEVWTKLNLGKSKAVKFNKLINRISEINVREISHSNTFSLPYIYENIQALGINVFNAQELARSLNSKYECKYYIDERVIQEGYLVINNTNNGVINVNFIDGSLSIVDNWGTVTYKELLENEDGVFEIPTDYQDSITEMQDYVLSQSELAVSLSEIGTRGYNLALFPNSLNAIGESFQLDENDLRQNNYFNVYQSRPIFNSKSVFDLACYAYGYEPIYDASVDWDKVSKHFIVSEGLSENYKEEGTSNNYGSNTVPETATVIDVTDNITSVMIAPAVRSFKPSEIPYWVSPNVSWGTDYLDTNCVFVPDDLTISNGVVKYYVTAPDETAYGVGELFSVWENSTVGGDVVFEPIVTSNVSEVDGGILEFEISKSELRRQPTGTNFLIGVVATVVETDNNTGMNTISSCQISETYLPIEAVSYDDYGQYLDQKIDLTYAAPEKTLKELLVGLMAKDGILMDINSKDKEITFFNYDIYVRKIEEGDVEDWSKYLRKYSPFNYNTDYGNSYGKINTISLSEPYSGNTYTKTLENQGSESKLKDTATNDSKIFKDVDSVKKIANTQTPYYEYGNGGLGLVRSESVLGDLTQSRADGTTQGTLTDLPHVVNTSFTDLSVGLTTWYTIIDQSVKAEPKFLLPIDVFKNLDIKKPIYINDLLGFYMVEEVAEYTNAQTEVTVKLIKVVDVAEFNNDFNNDFNI